MPISDLLRSALETVNVIAHPGLEAKTLRDLATEIYHRADPHLTRLNFDKHLLTEVEALLERDLPGVRREFPDDAQEVYVKLAALQLLLKRDIAEESKTCSLDGLRGKPRAVFQFSCGLLGGAAVVFDLYRLIIAPLANTTGDDVSAGVAEFVPALLLTVWATLSVHDRLPIMQLQEAIAKLRDEVVAPCRSKINCQFLALGILNLILAGIAGVSLFEEDSHTSGTSTPLETSGVVAFMLTLAALPVTIETGVLRCYYSRGIAGAVTAVHEEPLLMRREPHIPQDVEAGVDDPTNVREVPQTGGCLAWLRSWLPGASPAESRNVGMDLIGPIP